VLLQFDAVRESFGIAMPSMQDVGIILAMGFSVLISVEIVKAVLRRRTVPEQALAK
jgi:hypothetical protein